MADPEKKEEEIVIKLDGVKVKLEAIPPELRPDVERRIQEARELYESKYPKGKLRMNINVKVKTSKEAQKAAAAAPGGAPKPAVSSVSADDDGKPWPIIIFIALIVLGGAYLFVPAFSGAVDRVVEVLHRTKAPEPAAPAPAASATPAAAKP